MSKTSVVMRWLLWALVVFCTALVVGTSDPLVVQTVQGLLRGSKLQTYTGTSFFAFRGVRYAESPTGDNRFKPPVPVKSWGDDIRDAIEDGPICPQPDAEKVGHSSSEDCLFLNVYSKELSETAKKAVMVFIHYGGYKLFTGTSYWQGPQYLLDEDVVLVTINYRLGALGFVCTEDTVLPGNYGMKDQVEALTWVQQNIANFGGDPDRVTLWGDSAGGASVMLHMVSPQSKGLFHRAVAMSGSFTSGWATNRRPKDLAQRLANNLGCLTTESSQIYDCLLRHSAEEIISATEPIKDFELTPVALFAPVVEIGTGSDRFLPADPLEMFKAGDFAQVPLITGVTRNEFAVRGYSVLENKTLTEEFNQKFDHFAPIEFMYEREGKTSQSISAAIRKYYLKDQPISKKRRSKFMQIYTDSWITFSVIQVAQLIAVKNSKPVYLYMFDYQGKFSFFNIPGTKTPLGIAHLDDLIYLFYTSIQFPEFTSSDPDSQMVRTISSVLTSFADTGVPEITGKTTVWKPLTKAHKRYLKLTLNPKMKKGLPFSKRMSFWKSLFPLTGPHQEYY